MKFIYSLYCTPVYLFVIPVVLGAVLFKIKTIISIVDECKDESGGIDFSLAVEKIQTVFDFVKNAYPTGFAKFLVVTAFWIIVLFRYNPNLIF